MSARKKSDDLGDFCFSLLLGAGFIIGGILLFISSLKHDEPIVGWFAGFLFVLGCLQYYVMHSDAVEENEKRKREAEERLLEAYKKIKEIILINIPEATRAANKHLDQSEKEFSEGALVSFWVEIEHATRALAKYDECITSLNKNVKILSSTRHRAGMREKETKRAMKVNRDMMGGEMHRGIKTAEPIARHENFGQTTQNALIIDSLPPLALPPSKLADLRSTSDRLSAIVREAQKNYHFAAIYEQRKTSEILIAGFNNLEAAIYGIGAAIVSSLDALAAGLQYSLGALIDEESQQTYMLKDIRNEINHISIKNIKENKW